MGGFQAVAAGLGKTGADIATGQQDAFKLAMQNNALASQMGIAQQQVGLQKAQLDQSYQLAQQNHDLARQQLIASGWKDLGSTMDPATGAYYRDFTNLSTGESKRLPVQGTPPDSPAGRSNYFNSLKIGRAHV